MIRLALALALMGCTSPVEPPCVRLMVAVPGYELNADSLEAEGWNVLPGDTLAVLRIDQEACDA